MALDPKVAKFLDAIERGVFIDIGNDVPQFVEALKLYGSQPFYAKKVVSISARPAVSGEVIQTIVNGKLETTRKAVEGEWVATGAQGENYVISKESFEKKYVKHPTKKGVFVSKEGPQLCVTTPCDISFQAAWGEFNVKKGGVINITRLNENKCVGIAGNVFNETYKKLATDAATNAVTVASASKSASSIVSTAVMTTGSALPSTVASGSSVGTGVTVSGLTSAPVVGTTVGSGSLGTTTTVTTISAAKTGAAAGGAVKTTQKLFTKAGSATATALLVGATLPYEDIYKFVNDTSFRDDVLSKVKNTLTYAGTHPLKTATKVAKGIGGALWQTVRHPIDTAEAIAKDFKGSVEDNVKFFYESHAWKTGNGLVKQKDSKTGIEKEILLKDHKVVSETTNMPDGTSYCTTENKKDGYTLFYDKDGNQVSEVRFKLVDGKREITNCMRTTETGFYKIEYKDGQISKVTVQDGDKTEVLDYSKQNTSAATPINNQTLAKNATPYSEVEPQTTGKKKGMENA